MAKKKRTTASTAPAAPDTPAADEFATRAADIVRLEAEIHERLSRWLALEQQLGERLQARDAALARATAELAAERAQAEQLQSALREAREECARVSGQVTRQTGGTPGEASLKRQLREHRDAIAGLDQHAREQQKVLQKTEQERDALAAVLAELQETQSRARDELSRERERLSAVEAGVRTAEDLARRVEMLEGELAHERRLVASLTTELETSRDLAAQHETTLAAERLRVLELQKELTRATERDDQAAALREEIGRLGQRLQAADKAVLDQRALVDQLRAELRTRRRIIAVLGRDLARAKVLDGEAVASGPWVGPEPVSEPDAEDGAGGVRRLMIATEGGQIFRYPLKQKQVIIGRSSESDIRLGGGYTSRRHARILNADDEVVIEDLGSVNGITVNDQRVTRSVLRDGDLVEIGTTRFRFVDRLGVSTPVVHN